MQSTTSVGNLLRFQAPVRHNAGGNFYIITNSFWLILQVLVRAVFLPGTNNGTELWLDEDQKLNSLLECIPGWKTNTEISDFLQVSVSTRSKMVETHYNTVRIP